VPLLLLGITLGLDSFRAGVGLAALRPSWQREAVLGLAFGICDGLGTFTGLALGGALTGGPIPIAASYLGPAMLIGYGLWLISTSRERANENPLEPRWMIVGVPLAFSVDNVVSGVAFGLVQFPAPVAATIIGFVSGLMALGGLRFGGTAIRLLRVPAGPWTGTMMLLIGVMLAAD
jgi:putative Mn2+ efflux pump MntP